ncbi:MAG TPA: LssY C-terminal domain-containing protein [Thermoanaerobaculia bacterium]|nr:LssY C-terminal domain-containing protein [Thermoanaerobaculia bacterium]
MKNDRSNPLADPAAPGAPRRRRRSPLLWVGAAVVLYLVVAYLILPVAWRRRAHRHPDLAGGPRVTHTGNGIPGDPINLALVGSEADVVAAMIAAKWDPADPLTLASSTRIAVDSVFRRPDPDAPVSTLELFGRKQDLAFEQPVGNSPRQRHHVRFWKWDRLHDGREVWFGAATFDEKVGLSHTTAQVTHHIGPDVDAERDRILSEIKDAGRASDVSFDDGFHEVLEGKNGGGDPWHTDGRLGVASLVVHQGQPTPGR